MQFLMARNTRALLALATALLFFSGRSLADSMSFSAPAVPATALGLSGDLLSFHAGSAVFEESSGPLTFPTGDFRLGSSAVPDSTSDQIPDPFTNTMVTTNLDAEIISDPTPEPGSLLLLGSAILGLAIALAMRDRSPAGCLMEQRPRE